MSFPTAEGEHSVIYLPLLLNRISEYAFEAEAEPNAWERLFAVDIVIVNLSVIPSSRYTVVDTSKNNSKSTPNPADIVKE